MAQRERCCQPRRPVKGEDRLLQVVLAFMLVLCQVCFHIHTCTTKQTQLNNSENLLKSRTVLAKFFEALSGCFKKSYNMGWWLTSIIPALEIGRMRQGYCCEFEASLGYLGNSRSAWARVTPYQWTGRKLDWEEGRRKRKRKEKKDIVCMLGRGGRGRPLLMGSSMKSIVEGFSLEDEGAP